jgi:uncharacterized membrane protein YeaQ/YmgE (transglycosylase-associated protein family)
MPSEEDEKATREKLTEMPGNEHARRKPGARIRWLFAIIGAAFVLLQILATEKRVGQLRADGFSDVAISSTRNHAYFPIIGAVIGSLLFIGIFTAIKRMLKKDEY